MFEGTSGAISSNACTITTTPAGFSPQSGVELRTAVDAYLEYLDDLGNEKTRDFEATSPAARSDRGTFVCKPAVCLDKSCNLIGWYGNDTACSFADMTCVLHFRLTARESAAGQLANNHRRLLPHVGG